MNVIVLKNMALFCRAHQDNQFKYLFNNQVYKFFWVKDYTTFLFDSSHLYFLKKSDLTKLKCIFLN